MGTKLVWTPRTERRNVVLVHLESIRARSVTPYNKKLKTTPFLDELAKKSLLVERAYTIIPNSLKASISVNCGIEPPLYPGPEFEPGGIPSPCLASLLKEEGYNTVFFQSATQKFMYFGDQAKNLGYKEYYPVETMDTEGFERSNGHGRKQPGLPPVALLASRQPRGIRPDDEPRRAAADPSPATSR